MDYKEYIKFQRKKKNLSLTKAAKLMGISSSYLSSLENGMRPAPSNNLIIKTAEVLELNAKEEYQLFDLAAESKNPPTLADDLIEYIYKNPAIREMLRYSMECKLTEKEWNTIISFIKKNYHY